MKNDKDTLIELLANEDFRKWILEPTYERDLFWNKRLENNPDKVELVNAAREFLRSLEYRKFPLKPGDKDKILSNIIAQTSIKTGPSEFDPKRKRLRSTKLFYKIAASFLLICLGVLWWKSSLQETGENANEQLAIIKKENPQGRKSTILLPDRTRVILNADSRLTYDSDYGKHSRTVRVEGEAFFEVKPDVSRPFNVISRDIVTTALGTSFNVRAFDGEDRLEISLKTGKVKVKKLNDSNSQGQVLDPGEGLMISQGGNKIEKVRIDPLITFGWKDGILVFKDNSLQEVIVTLERWYGVKIKTSGQPHSQWKVNGRFENKTLEQVLNSLGFTYDLEFEITGKNVELKF